MLSSGRYSELPSGQGLDGFCEMFYYNEERKQFQTAASKTWRRRRRYAEPREIPGGDYRTAERNRRIGFAQNLRTGLEQDNSRYAFW